MKKIAIFLVFLLLSGCSRITTRRSHHPVVTAITITQLSPQPRQVREFTTDGETSQVLNYLRQLDYGGNAQVNPEYVAGPMYEFTLHYSDGSQDTLRQKADRYFQASDGVWQEIQPYSGCRLVELLEEIGTLKTPPPTSAVGHCP